MNRPPLPGNPSAKRTGRPEQNLASFAPRARGAVLFPLIPKIRESNSWISVKRKDVPVKNVRNSFCTPVFSKSFTLVRCNCLKETPMENLASKRPGGKNTKTGGSDPTFSAFSRPKSSWGRSRPFFAPGKKAQQPEALRVAPVFGDASAKHYDLTEFRTKACMTGPQKGEPKKCQF